jgi:xanthine dehydrogenase accessory factor
MRRDVLEAVATARRERRAIALVTELATGSSRVVRQDELADDPMGAVLAPLFLSGRSMLLKDVAGGIFVNIQSPPPRLMIVGAVHIAQSLVPMAELVGLEVTLIDPRQGFATSERFPGLGVLAEWPERVLADRPLDRFTAVAALSHEPRIDDLPLAAGLRAGCFYVGALGSRRTHASRLERLRLLGFDSAELGRIRAPIGLDIDAVSPAEIATAILAEIIMSRRRPHLPAPNS